MGFGERHACKRARQTSSAHAYNGSADRNAQADTGDLDGHPLKCDLFSMPGRAFASRSHSPVAVSPAPRYFAARTAASQTLQPAR